MHTMNYSAFGRHLVHTPKKVKNNHKFYEETAYLMASPKNAERLNQAIAEINSAETKKHALIRK